MIGFFYSLLRRRQTCVHAYIHKLSAFLFLSLESCLRRANLQESLPSRRNPQKIILYLFSLRGLTQLPEISRPYTFLVASSVDGSSRNSANVSGPLLLRQGLTYQWWVASPMERTSQASLPRASRKALVPVATLRRHTPIFLIQELL